MGIFKHPILKSILVFGGTALKKGYFGEYRFSEDLDFSVKGEIPGNLLQHTNEACKNAETQIGAFAPIRLYVKKYEEKMPHPDGQQAFVISAQFPWQSATSTSQINLSIAPSCFP